MAVAPVLCDAVNLRDVRVVERRQHLCLSVEPSEAVRIVGERIREDLQCDVAVELRVACTIDLAHPSFANEGGDGVVPKTGTHVQGHSLDPIAHEDCPTVSSTVAASNAMRSRSSSASWYGRS